MQLDAPMQVAGWQTVSELAGSVQTGVGARKRPHL